MSEEDQEKKYTEIQAALERIRKYDSRETEYCVWQYIDDCEMVANWFAFHIAQKPKLSIAFHRDDEGTFEKGPLYKILLPKCFPIGNGNMMQAAPCQAELRLCSERFPRVAAAYEVAVAIVLELTSRVD